ncbi:MAG: NAD(P)-dependent oxidoreductase [Candidatus Magasanikbacteria bacterium]|nr:NAD(P)-dependent oxidoreductase [Candidatus Magasanikbacteria bacterium]
MKILITGGAGYIGSCLIPELLNAGHQVRVLDSLLFGQTSLLPYFINKNFEFIKGDIRNVELVQKAVNNMDVIIHLAAIVGAPACKKDPKVAEEVNFVGTVNVNNARDVSQKLFYASTGSVYGKVEDICKEDLPAKPLSSYGETKLRAEQEVMRKGNAIAYRFATAFGLSSRLRLDLMPNDFVFNALKNKYLVVYDKGFKRTFIHVRDIVSAYMFGINNFENMKNEVYNIGSEKMNKTKEDVANMIREKLNFEILFVDKGIPDPDQRDYAVSYEKIRSKGFDTKISFEEAIDELILGLQTVHIANPYSNMSSY